MQAFGRKQTHCNLGCRRFGRKRTLLETDVQILCLTCAAFQMIASVPQPLAFGEQALAICRRRAGYWWQPRLLQSEKGLGTLNLQNVGLVSFEYFVSFVWVSCELESNSFQPVLWKGIMPQICRAYDGWKTLSACRVRFNYWDSTQSLQVSESRLQEYM